VFVRPTTDRSRLDGLPVRFVVGDVREDADVRRALEARPVRVVVDALGRSESPPEFYATSAASIARWSRATGVGQMILHGSVGAGDSRDAIPGAWHGRLRRVLEAKDAGERAVVASGVPYTIIRNASLWDPPGDSGEHARLVADPAAVGAVSRRGLARLTRGCVLAAACMNRVFHAVDDSMTGGPR
jgi:uncharacterized protein YbjT (DUF2867 family)